MSPSRSEFRSPEYLTALDARRLTISYIGVVSIIGSMFMLATQYSYFPEWQARVTLLQLPLLPFIYVWRRRDIGAWLGMTALLFGVLGTAFTTHTSDARVSASTALFILSYFGIVMLHRGWQWIWILGMATVWAFIVPVVELPITFSGVTYNFRWGTFVQLLIASAGTMAAWNREFDAVHERDELAMRIAERRAESLITRERLRVWRESLVRVHETLLNDIRSVLDAVQIDGSRLRRQLATSELLTPPQRDTQQLHELIAPLAVTQAQTQRLVIGKLPELHLDQQYASALRSALLEIVRNQFRHSDVTLVKIDATLSHDVLQLVLSTDTSIALPTGAQTGIGIGVVLRESLQTLGAELERHADRTVLRMPLVRSESEPRETVRLDAGRVMLSAVGAGNALGGALFFFALAITYDWHGLVMAACGLFTAVVSITAVYRRSAVSARLLLCTAIAASIVPLFARQEIEACGRAELPLIVTALTSLGFYAVVVWAPSLRWWWVSMPFLLELVWLANEAMQFCTASVAPPLTAAFAAPILMCVVLVTTWSSARSAEQLQELRIADIRESAAASAASAIGDDLHSAVTAARQLLMQVAESNGITDEERWRLRCLDSEIRATIQVDPESAGSMSLAARASIHAAAASGVPSRVLVLRDSGDRRPLPETVIDTLQKLLLAATDGSASVQILSNARDDVLTLTVSDASRQRAGIDDGWSHPFESGEATMDAGDELEPALFLIRRQVAMPAPDSSTLPTLAH